MYGQTYVQEEFKSRLGYYSQSEESHANSLKKITKSTKIDRFFIEKTLIDRSVILRRERERDILI